LQNDPADIPALLKKAKEGWDVVSGWRKRRQDAFISRKIPSRIANWIISKVTGVFLHDYGCTLKVYRKDIVANFRLSGDMHRFLPALASWQGASITELPVNHRPRVAGKSHYGIGRTLKVILDLIAVKFLLSYSTRPIQFFGMGGILLLFLGMITGVNVVWTKCVDGQDMTDNPLLYLVVLFAVIGIQFIMMGLLGEILTRIYQESKKELIYTIKEIH